jgi:hypothetical protein
MVYRIVGEVRKQADDRGLTVGIDRHDSKDQICSIFL